ncbi:MAG: cell wall-binding repeat-containing protein [Bacillota bacterium]|nr:cell wall-binding repeat-containing protein [Bacillota bacterium]
MKKVIVLFSILFLFIILPNTTKAQENRISGANRFEVAVHISEQNWPNGSNTVFLINHLAYADALSVAPLAYQENAPILLSTSESLTPITKQEITRLNPQKAVLVGGTTSLNNQIIKDLKSLNVKSITRIDGKNRYDISAKVALKMPKPQTFVFVNGFDFSDALSIAPFAAKQGYPILLTEKDQLPDSIMNFDVKHSIIVGNEDSVSENVEASLNDPVRIGGADSYEVSANIAKTFFPHPSKAFLATAIPDAIAGSVIAAKDEAPILMTGLDQADENIQSYIIKKQVNQITLLGGSASIKDGMYYIPGNWKIKNPAGDQLQGYTDKTSYLPGDHLHLFINSANNYTVEVYRMGYYNGDGAELKGTYGEYPAFQQTAFPDQETMAANWSETGDLSIPSNWESGMYLIKLIDSDLKESYIPFVVKSPNPRPNGIGVVISVNTYQAYNNWGGKSLYGYNSSDSIASYKVSFNRPYIEQNGAGEFFSYEYNMIRWLEKEGYNLSYYTDQDIDQGDIWNSQLKLLLFPGHDEYWTMKSRNEIETLSQTNLNLGIFNANMGLWQVRYEDQNRTMVSYKGSAYLDPYQQIDPSLVTTQFRNPPVNRPERNIFGLMYEGVPDATAPLTVSNATHWLYNGTGLKDGDQIPGVVGGEVDRYYGDPSNVEVIAHSPTILYGMPDYSDVIWYQKPGGGKVFAVGTFYWNWFLDPYGHETVASYNPAIERITLNAFDQLMQ